MLCRGNLSAKLAGGRHPILMCSITSGRCPARVRWDRHAIAEGTAACSNTLIMASAMIRNCVFRSKWAGDSGEQWATDSAGKWATHSGGMWVQFLGTSGMVDSVTGTLDSVAGTVAQWRAESTGVGEVAQGN